MGTKMTHVGFGHYLNTDEIVAIAALKAAPIKRSVQVARGKRLIVDLTNGRRTKSVVFTDSKHLVLTSLEPVTIMGRVADGV